MVDALASGASVCMDVEVRVLSWAPLNLEITIVINDIEAFWDIFIHLNIHPMSVEL